VYVSEQAKGEAYLAFGWDPTTGHCTYIRVENYSHFVPKAPW
jgi:hypothetical protein